MSCTRYDKLYTRDTYVPTESGMSTSTERENEQLEVASEIISLIIFISIITHHSMLLWVQKNGCLIKSLFLLHIKD